MSGYILVLTILLRLALPAVNRAVQLDLAQYYPAVVAFLAVFNGGLLGGTIVGFMLLEERENDTIRPLLVSPLPLDRYLNYRIVVPAVFGFFLVAVQLLILRGLAPLPVYYVIPVAGGAAFTASVVTLAFATLAQNRIQGFALLKFVGVGGFIVGGAWFAPEPWQYLIGVFPPYWISKSYWLALEGSSYWWAALLPGILLHAIFIQRLKDRFSDVTRQS
jgi:fluoroquinolone transport system permease protein